MVTAEDFPDKTLTEIEESDDPAYDAEGFKDDEEVIEQMDDMMKGCAVLYTLHWLVLEDEITMRHYIELIDVVEEQFCSDILF